MEHKRRHGIYKLGAKNSGINKSKNQRAKIPSKKVPSAGSIQSTVLLRKIHLEYLNIMQRHYAEQYENLSRKFYAKFGQQGEKAKTTQQRLTFDRFQSERNNLFQGSQYKRLHQLIERISDDRGSSELYTLTDQHQQGMKKTLRNLQSML